MRLGIVMLHYGSLQTTKHTLRLLSARTPSDTTLYLINNSQTDLSSLSAVFPHIKIVNNAHNLGFAKAVNQGIKLAIQAKADVLLLLNNDVQFLAGSLTQLATTLLSRPTLGVLAPLLHHAHGYDWGGHYSPWTGMVRHRNWDNPPKTLQQVDHVAGAAMMFTPALISQVGLFDERFFLYYEDLDFCLRVRSAGYQIQITPHVTIEHHTSSSSSLLSRTLAQWRSHFLFVTKHLFKRAYPTAYLYTLFIYPLYLLKSLISQR